MSQETWVIKVDMPPKGKLEEGEAAGGLTDEDMQEELRYRQEFLDYVSPRLAALPGRPLRRSGNVIGSEIHGADKWSTLNRYRASSPKHIARSISGDGSQVMVKAAGGERKGPKIAVAV